MTIYVLFALHFLVAFVMMGYIIKINAFDQKDTHLNEQISRRLSKRKTNMHEKVVTSISYKTQKQGL